jgi:hypothetical protein
LKLNEDNNKLIKMSPKTKAAATLLPQMHKYEDDYNRETGLSHIGTLVRNVLNMKEISFKSHLNNRNINTDALSLFKIQYNTLKK